MKWVLPALSARALFSWTGVRSSRIPFRSNSSRRRRPSVPVVFFNCSRFEIQREHQHVKEQIYDSDRRRCCLHRNGNARARAADTVPPLRDHEEQETAGVSVSSLLFDLIPESEDRSD